MGGEALRTIREAVLRQGEVPVELNVEYRVVYSTLQGNMPVNDRIHGSILGVPVDVRLETTTVPNTYGAFPVNRYFSGSIGDTPIEGRMAYTLRYSTIAGNFPVNTGIDLTVDGAQYHLDMPVKFALGRGRGSGSAGGGGSSKKKYSSVFVRGKMMSADEVPGGGEGGMSYEVHRPISAGIQGVIEGVQLDLRFSYTYFTNTSSGQNPINNYLSGVLKAVA
jgi:hypothetical protein